MYNLIKISIFLNILNSFSFIYAAYLEVESNYVKPKLERNNIVNKGLWIRNNRDRKYVGDFIFKANSLDADDVLQNNYDAFGQSNAAGSAIFSGFNVERNRRSPNEISKSLSAHKVKCDNNSNCPNVGVESKFISTLKPASILNDYPYEIAVILDNKKDHFTDFTNANPENNDETENKNNYQKVTNQQSIKNSIRNKNSTTTNDEAYTIYLNGNLNNRYTNRTSIIPKRSMSQHDYKSELSNKIELTEDFNITDPNINKIGRNIFDKEDMVLQNAPIPKFSVYKILPKRVEDVKPKSLNERGLLKVLSMLTKTFKKIKKQHQDIKRIHNKIYDLSDEFTKNSDVFTSRYEDFNTKYLFMRNLHDKMKIMEAMITEKEQSFSDKEKDLSKNLKEFENEQKKFLAQQRQFYNIQKLMLAQNERINFKQNEIAKTQSEISNRQNQFARILKKAKQIYVGSGNINPTRLHTGIAKPKIKPGQEKVEPLRVVQTTTFTTTNSPPPTTETVKIDLFSIPTLSHLENQDQLILDEKDNQPIDDLIYKYYFNNTFIDDLMKSKVLATFQATASEATDSNVTKNKRTEKAKTTTTVLIPVNNTAESKKKQRNRRWIKRSKKNNEKKNFKGPPTPIMKTVPNNKEKVVHTEVTTDYSKKDITKKVDPFITMALSFCREIGQNLNLQVLNWCVEKALRRLKVVDLKMTPLMAASPPATVAPQLSQTEVTVSLSETPSTQKLQNHKDQNPVTTEDINAVYFPDNDELENKLKEYDLKPDPEGTVYYDGSLHDSDIARIGDADSGGFSDIMPGLDSNSRIQVDPMAFDLQAQRRADVRKINERIIKMGMDR